MQHHFETTECAEFSAMSVAAGWDTDYRQVEGGAFSGSLDVAFCPELRVTDQFCSRSMIIDGTPPEGHLALLLPTYSAGTGIFQGEVLSASQVALMEPSAAGTYRTPSDFHMRTASIPVTRIAQALEAVAQLDAAPLIRGTRVTGIQPRIREQLALLVDRLLAFAHEQRVPQTAVDEAEQQLVAALSLGLAGPIGQVPGERARTSRIRCVRRARDYIEAHLHTPLGVETLCNATGVSARTLDYAFRDVLDVTPLQYVKSRRLHAARRRLRASSAGEHTVTQIALGCGLPHLGYFARDYKALFGEGPRETLRSAPARRTGARVRSGR